MGPFVDVAWLRAHLDEVVVCDLRWSLGGGPAPAEHAAGHVPGALHVDLDADLSGPASASAGRHPLPSPGDFAATLGRLGIRADDAVVAHDTVGGGIASRLVWMLRALGQPAALLDGGLAAWRAAGEPIEVGATTRPEVTVEARPWPASLLADADAVAAADVVVDARDAARFRGESAGPDARAGHVPGAVNVPWADNVDDDGLLRPDEALRRVHGPLVADGRVPVVSCGSGVTACHDLLVLEHLGLGRGRLYPGSWSQWSADPARPVETGA